MKSLRRRYENIRVKNPDLSDYICFASAVEKANFTRRSIAYWFRRLVDKDDYDPKSERDLLSQLTELSKRG